MRPIASLVLCLLATPVLAQSEHPCAEDARTRGELLLRFHYDDTTAEVGVDGEVTELPPVEALVGNGAFDVLEVWGYVYRAEYRMRFLYAQVPDSCLLMGEEILESSDPY